jgi:hypothetical protein
MDCPADPVFTWRTVRVGIGLVVVFLAVVCGGLGACGDDKPEAGSDCKTDKDCGSMSCFCANDPVPGTCSIRCRNNSDCASLGSGYSCGEFGDGVLCSTVNICLRWGG